MVYPADRHIAEDEEMAGHFTAKKTRRTSQSRFRPETQDAAEGGGRESSRIADATATIEKLFRPLLFLPQRVRLETVRQARRKAPPQDEQETVSVEESKVVKKIRQVEPNAAKCRLQERAFLLSPRVKVFRQYLGPYPPQVA